MQINTSARSADALQADGVEKKRPSYLILDRGETLNEGADVPSRQNPHPGKGSGKPAPVDNSPAVITMPVVGGGMYPVTEDACRLFRETYPTLDIGQCIRSAKLWLVSNPSKVETPRGMPKFLAGWMERALNRGQHLLVNASRSVDRTTPPARESLSERNRRAGEELIALVQARAHGVKKS